MSLFQVVITAALTTLATLALGVVAVWSLWPTSAEAGVAIAAHSSAWHSGDVSHCAHLSSEHLQHHEAAVSAALELDDFQQSALQAVAAGAEQWRAQAQATCENTDLTSLDGSLAGLEAILEQSSTAMAELRPAIVEFHQSLNPEQQAQLHEFMQSHGGHRRHGGFGHH